MCTMLASTDYDIVMLLDLIVQLPTYLFESTCTYVSSSSRSGFSYYDYTNIQHWFCYPLVINENQVRVCAVQPHGVRQNYITSAIAHFNITRSYVTVSMTYYDWLKEVKFFLFLVLAGKSFNSRFYQLRLESTTLDHTLWSFAVCTLGLSELTSTPTTVINNAKQTDNYWSQTSSNHVTVT